MCALCTVCSFLYCFFFNDTATTEIYTLSLHDALPIWRRSRLPAGPRTAGRGCPPSTRSEEHTSELQSPYVISYAVFCFKKKKTHSDILNLSVWQRFSNLICSVVSS